MKYYFYIDPRPWSSNFRKANSVHRWYITTDGIKAERWNGKEWAFDPVLLTAIRLGDRDYRETSEAEALEFVINHTA